MYIAKSDLLKQRGAQISSPWALGRGPDKLNWHEPVLLNKKGDPTRKDTGVAL